MNDNLRQNLDSFRSLLDRLREKRLLIPLALALFLLVFFLPNPLRSTPLPTSDSSLFLKTLQLFSRKEVASSFSSFYSFAEDSFTLNRVILLSPSKAIVISDVDSAPYRALLEKTSDGSWTPVTLPKIVFAYDDYPDLSPRLIETLNSLKEK